MTPYISADDYAYIGTSGTQVICWLGYQTTTWPTAMFNAVHDLSSAEEFPVIVIGGVPLAATYLPSAAVTLWTEPQVALTGNSKILARHFSGFTSPLISEWERWKVVAGIPSEATPEATLTYVPDYYDVWNQEALLSTFGGLYPGLCGSYWRGDVHQAWVEAVKSDGETDTWRVQLGRCSTFSPMKVPDYAVDSTGAAPSHWAHIKAFSQPFSLEGQWPMWEAELSYYDDFRTVFSTLVDQWNQWWLGYGVAEFWLHGYTQTVYMRMKRMESLPPPDQTTILSETGWCTTVAIPATAVDEVLLDESVHVKVPYHVEKWSTDDTGDQTWNITIGTLDQDVQKFRVQIATSSAFTTIVTDEEQSPSFPGQLGQFGSITREYHCPIGAYYVRVRSENIDGSVVSAWSNVFELDSTTPVDRRNSAKFTHGTLVVETHDTSVESTKAEMAFLANDTLSYALLNEDDNTYLYTITSTGFTRVLFEAFQLTYRIIVAFGGRTYVGYQSYEDDVSHPEFFWRDVTDGTIGDKHTVAPPVDSDGFAWVTLANIYGKLEVVAGVSYVLGDGYESCLATQAVLNGETTLEVFRDIMAGWSFQVDVWHNSIWFNYEDWDWTLVGVTWLGRKTQSNAVWYMGI